jgi:hypothetical protein
MTKSFFSDAGIRAKQQILRQADLFEIEASVSQRMMSARRRPSRFIKRAFSAHSDFSCRARFAAREVAAYFSPPHHAARSPVLEPRRSQILVSVFYQT